MKNPETVERAYSMASFPAEGREIMLNVRIATPPWDRNNNDWMMLTQEWHHPIFFQKQETRSRFQDLVNWSFFINHSEAEMLCWRRCRMAPMRSHLYELFRTLKTGRKVTFWYGGRSKKRTFLLGSLKSLEK